MKFVEKGFCFFYISYLCVTQIVRNMKKQILLSCALAWAVMAGAETIDITTFRYAGPYIVQAPFQVDSVDVKCFPLDPYPHSLSKNLFSLFQKDI